MQNRHVFIALRYRAHLAICAEVLIIAKEGARKTQTLYGSNQCSAYLRGTLDLLLGRKLLEYVKEEKLYFTTTKGLKFPKIYHELIAEFSTLQDRTLQRKPIAENLDDSLATPQQVTSVVGNA